MTTSEQSTMTPPAERSTMDELKDVRRALQEAGVTLLQAATAAINAAAKETLSATNAVIAAAADTLEATELKVRKLREQLRNKG